MSKCKVYVAGPWVFRPDAKEHAEVLRATVEKFGFEALIPIDSESDSAYAIKCGNRDMIQQADYVIADITPFRGASMDSGTAYEVGYAEALNIPVFLWSLDQRAYKDRVTPDGMMVEDFGMLENLMITSGNAVVDESFDAAAHTVRIYDDEVG